ncbi:myb family transcription factor family protein [Salix suchowensis]|nr:myb family transcription factor family protein [Salix suchowensis]
MASTSCAKQSPTLLNEPVMNNVQYPTPGATYEDVIVSPNLFMETLEKFHAAMGTKFMIPIIGGKELNLHRLFVEVTSRGGIEKIIRERRWKEVTGVFNFPSTATNASFVLRKYYGSLLRHYEQLYYFKARSWSPASPVPLQSSLISQSPAQVTVQPSPEYQAATVKHQTANIAELRRAMPGSSANSPVIGVIDGKFESGYLVTVTVGSEKLKGVLYQAPPQNQSWQVPQPRRVPANNSEATPKTIMRTMGVKGLTLYHLKSHLQKYRLGKQSCKESTDNSKDVGIAPSVAESQDTGSSTSASSRMIAQDLNDGHQVTEALRVQMEVQRRLHEQLEVQRHLQLRIEAQGKYLQSILEKARKALDDQAVATAGLEAAREELSELAIKVSNECAGIAPLDTMKMSSLSELAAALENRNASNVHARIGDCSVESCLTSTSSPVSPMGAGSQVASTKKRSRPVFGNGDSLPFQGNIRQEVEWTMRNIG